MRLYLYTISIKDGRQHMRTKTQLYLSIICMIVLFDCAGALASRWLHFDYTKLIWASLCLYILSGYWAVDLQGLKGGVIAGLVAGLADSTIGWALSSAIHPALTIQQRHPSDVTIIFTIWFVTLLAIPFALMGAFIRLWVKRLQNKL
jgi:hypothetical protein